MQLLRTRSLGVTGALAPAHLQGRLSGGGVISRFSRPQRPSKGRQTVRTAAFKKFSPLGGLARWTKQDEGELLLDLLLSYPALYGTAAVVLSLVLGYPSLGGFHWDASDAWLGLQLAVPIMLLDLPLVELWEPDDDEAAELEAEEEEEEEGSASEDWNLDLALLESQLQQQLPPAAALSRSAPPQEWRQEDSLRQGMAALSAELSAGQGVGADRGAGKDGEEEEEEYLELPLPFFQALDNLRTVHTYEGAWMGLSLPSQLGLIAVHHLGEEMLWRGVLLHWLAALGTAALYAVGAEDAAAGLAIGAGWQSEVPQAAAVFAAAVAVGWSASAAFWREYGVLSLLEGHPDSKITVDMSMGLDLDASIEQAKKLLDDDSEWVADKEELVAYMRRERLWAGVVEAVRDGGATACLSAAFLLTGNLLAPYLAAVVSDLAFTAYQRSQREQAMDSVQFWDDLAEKTLAAVQAEQEERVARLAPRPVRHTESKGTSPHGRGE